MVGYLWLASITFFLAGILLYVLLWEKRGYIKELRKRIAKQEEILERCRHEKDNAWSLYRELQQNMEGMREKPFR